MAPTLLVPFFLSGTCRGLPLSYRKIPGTPILRRRFIGLGGVGCCLPIGDYRIHISVKSPFLAASLHRRRDPRRSQTRYHFLGSSWGVFFFDWTFLYVFWGGFESWENHRLKTLWLLLSHATFLLGHDVASSTLLHSAWWLPCIFVGGVLSEMHCR